MKQNNSVSTLDKTSYDAPPLDFSNMNVKTLQDLKHIIPKQGKRKQVPTEESKEEKKKEKPQENESNAQIQQVTQAVQEDEDKMDEEEKEKERERREKERLKELRGIPQIIRTVGQPIILSTNINKPTIDEKKQTKKQFKIQLIQSSLILSYNKIPSIHNFYNIIDTIIQDSRQLQWIDLSHNMIESIEYNFSDFVCLKALYLHANKLKDITEFQKLQGLTELRTLTVHEFQTIYYRNTPYSEEIGFCSHLKKGIGQCISVAEHFQNDQSTYNQNMKLYLEILNYESDLNNFIVKVKLGTQVMQTILGNTWNQRFTLENKRSTDLKVEVWQKVNNDFQLVGDAVVPKEESLHKLDIVSKGKIEGILNVIYKEAQKDATILQVIQQDSENIQRLQKPEKLLQKLNESLQIGNTNGVHQDFASIQEYFSQTWNDTELTQQSKQSANQLIKESFDKVTAQVKVNEITYHIDDQDHNLSQTEQAHINQLQKQLIKNDIQKYEKNRREVNVQILDLDELNQKLRIDQVDQKARVQIYRKELIQKLLYIEDKIEHLKKTYRSTNHHVFSSNQNLLNSQIEMSQISIQKEFVAKWESDPKQDEIRQEFVKKQMKEWTDLQEKRLQKIGEQEIQIKKTEQQIQQQQQLVREAKTNERKQQAEQKLQDLQVKQAEREKNLQEANRRYEEKKKEQYLAMKYAQQDALYISKLQEERIKKLKEIKNPDFDIQEIKQFEQKLDQIRIEKAANRRKQWDDREAKWNKFKAQYYSENYKKAKEQSRQINVVQEEQKLKLQERLESQRKYDYEVRQNHKPTVSQTKKDEMEENVRRIKFEPNFKRYRELSEKIKEKHIYYGIEKKETKNKIKLKPLETIPTPISPRKIGEYYLKENGTYNKKHIPPLPKMPNPPQSSHSEKKMKVTDFLKEQRLKKAQQESQSQKDAPAGMPTLDVDDYRMVNQIKKKLEKLEQQDIN